MKTLYWVLAALILAFGIGWFTHQHYAMGKYTAALAKADTLQARIDIAQEKLRLAEDSIRKVDSVSAIADSLNHIKIVQIAQRELEIVDSLRKVPNVPPEVLTLIDSLVTTNVQERTVWENEVSLLKDEFTTEHTLRLQTEAVLLDTKQENAALRIALNKKPTQVVMGNSLLKDVLIASLAVNAFQYALHH